MSDRCDRSARDESQGEHSRLLYQPHLCLMRIPVQRYTTRQLESHHEFAYHSQKLQFRRYLSKETGETYYFKDKEHKEDDIDYGGELDRRKGCHFAKSDGLPP